MKRPGGVSSPPSTLCAKQGLFRLYARGVSDTRLVSLFLICNLEIPKSLKVLHIRECVGFYLHVLLVILLDSFTNPRTVILRGGGSGHPAAGGEQV